MIYAVIAILVGLSIYLYTEVDLLKDHNRLREEFSEYNIKILYNIDEDKMLIAKPSEIIFWALVKDGESSEWQYVDPKFLDRCEYIGGLIL